MEEFAGDAGEIVYEEIEILLVGVPCEVSTLGLWLLKTKDTLFTVAFHSANY